MNQVQSRINLLINRKEWTRMYKMLIFLRINKAAPHIFEIQRFTPYL